MKLKTLMKIKNMKKSIFIIVALCGVLFSATSCLALLPFVIFSYYHMSTLQLLYLIGAITITLSNALQVAFRSETKEEMNRVAVQEKTEKHGPSVAKSDSIKTDSLRHTDTDAVTIK